MSAAGTVVTQDCIVSDMLDLMYNLCWHANIENISVLACLESADFVVVFITHILARCTLRPKRGTCLLAAP